MQFLFTYAGGDGVTNNDKDSQAPSLKITPGKTNVTLTFTKRAGSGNFAGYFATLSPDNRNSTSTVAKVRSARYRISWHLGWNTSALASYSNIVVAVFGLQSVTYKGTVTTMVVTGLKFNTAYSVRTSAVRPLGIAAFEAYKSTKTLK